VPPGWFWSGGDPAAAGAPLPRRRLWADGFVIRRFPVTNAEYLEFLNDLLARDRESEALAAVPRVPAPDGPGQILLARDPDTGAFVLGPDAHGDVWLARWPVFYVNWFGAAAYCDWLAASDGLPWRLPGELEWEKAARGVDGRAFPWGDFFDPTWTWCRASRRGRGLPAEVDEHPQDVSPFGVFGMGGNASEWCADAYRRDGPPGVEDGARTLRDAAAAECVIRGGNWASAPSKVRCAYRGSAVRQASGGYVSFRVARYL
jgi:serine/threonine-protein kinase